MPPLTLVMPTISWEEPFGTCLHAALASLGQEDDALVVFDGVPPPPPDWLLHSRARLLSTGQRSGPAPARNLAARQACGEILLFVVRMWSSTLTPWNGSWPLGTSTWASLPAGDHAPDPPAAAVVLPQPWKRL
jgi:hypothetical protein